MVKEHMIALIMEVISLTCYYNCKLIFNYSYVISKISTRNLFLLRIDANLTMKRRGGGEGVPVGALWT